MRSRQSPLADHYLRITDGMTAIALRMSEASLLHAPHPQIDCSTN